MIDRRSLLKSLCFIPVLNRICFSDELCDIAKEIQEPVTVQQFNSCVIRIRAEMGCKNGEYAYFDRKKQICTNRRIGNENLCGIFCSKQEENGDINLMVYGSYV